MVRRKPTPLDVLAKTVDLELRGMKQNLIYKIVEGGEESEVIADIIVTQSKDTEELKSLISLAIFVARKTDGHKEG